MKRIILGLCLLVSFMSNEISAQYRGMTFDEMMKPLLLYRNFFDECDQELSTLMQNAQRIEPYIDRQKDPRCWETYQRYYAEVCGAYNSLHERGTTSNTKSHIRQTAI